MTRNLRIRAAVAAGLAVLAIGAGAAAHPLPGHVADGSGGGIVLDTVTDLPALHGSASIAGYPLVVECVEVTAGPGGTQRLYGSGRLAGWFPVWFLVEDLLFGQDGATYSMGIVSPTADHCGGGALVPQWVEGSFTIVP